MRPAGVTQADIARVLRAAAKAGVDTIEVHPADGMIRIILYRSAPPSQNGAEPEANPTTDKDIVL